MDTKDSRGAESRDCLISGKNERGYYEYPRGYHAVANEEEKWLAPPLSKPVIKEKTSKSQPQPKRDVTKYHNEKAEMIDFEKILPGE